MDISVNAHYVQNTDIIKLIPDQNVNDNFLISVF
jgi:hypothetical protein